MTESRRGGNRTNGTRRALLASTAWTGATLMAACSPPPPQVVAIDPTPPVLVPPPGAAEAECAATAFTPCAEGEPCPVVRAVQLCGAIEALLPTGPDDAKLVVNNGTERLLVDVGADETTACSLGSVVGSDVGLLPWRGGRWRLVLDGGVVRGNGTMETIGGLSPSARLLRAGADGDDAAWAFFLDGANVTHVVRRAEDWVVEPVRSECWTPLTQYRLRGTPYAACDDGTGTRVLPGLETTLPSAALAPLVLDTPTATLVAWLEPITASPEDTAFWSQLGQYVGTLPALFVARAGAEATDRKATVMAPAIASGCTAAGWQQPDAYQHCTVRGEQPSDFRLAAAGDGTPWVVWTVLEHRLEQGALAGGHALEAARLVVGEGTPTVERFVRLPLDEGSALVRHLAASGTRLHVALGDRYLVLDTALPAAPPPARPVATATAEPEKRPCPQEGQLRCEGRCVDVTRDEANCGYCGLSCDPGWSCVVGECLGPACTTREDCPEGLTCDISASFPCEPSDGCTCTTDAECGVDAVCTEGLCGFKECRRSSDCTGPGASCRRGAPGQHPVCMPRGRCR
ncbi:MAG: hypothetical protein JXB32_23400 [Deltaproteobacteria bacterium]|nr:hypothetical protein [Deltaproteobacteria bacterium]